MILATFTFAFLFYRDVKNHKKSKRPLGFRTAKNGVEGTEDKKKSEKCETQNLIFELILHFLSCVASSVTKIIIKKTKIPEDIDYIVIGSGIGGLSCAAALSRCGRKVLVLEQHDRLGGCMHTFGKS
ncbi:hypothetical protein RFI_01526 [Reticulomyxa filosa]|uniref:All-trans-retinol 13,14-reductase n=1 Tax=Reticulomyxa filosa TaxID=46433 RepID=X6PBP3_RETFI|nr:hypothetical protein RFI_01526 [Reticulomyxa filosa]|eukprot:ETO35538.1 hypothetical protein RFI_01526 [Reticulomyxa filosa]